MKRILLVAVSATGLITIAACGNSGSAGQDHSPTDTARMSSTMTMPGATNTSPGEHNVADVTFATDMIPHHRQAIQMADTASTKAVNAEVKSLATKIKSAQAPEIAQMSDWLTGWGSPLPGTSMRPGMSMPGMMSEADMTSLGKASGTEFDRMWVEMMIKHHSGAIAMARTELAQGKNTDAKALAQSIITGQSAEIAQLRTLLPELGS
jgi:uncharacterized protein (DUF305 family)